MPKPYFCRYDARWAATVSVVSSVSVATVSVAFTRPGNDGLTSGKPSPVGVQSWSGRVSHSQRHGRAGVGARRHSPSRSRSLFPAARTLASIVGCHSGQQVINVRGPGPEAAEARLACACGHQDFRRLGICTVEWWVRESARERGVEAGTGPGRVAAEVGARRRTAGLELEVGHRRAEERRGEAENKGYEVQKEAPELCRPIRLLWSLLDNGTVFSNKPKPKSLNNDSPSHRHNGSTPSIEHTTPSPAHHSGMTVWMQ
ncbi:hypothetical protein B0H15DRAFT_803361 [Mycena belliarum]|uniref:Uncharacterized protein n=1 Tax=Mycena belliarum TaxID=1033014 RepID=A0AAD6XMX2_9AGAR|nr:hypothetical protein B0H15DRAFT_803361 [Mycena belliae]